MNYEMLPAGNYWQLFTPLVQGTASAAALVLCPESGGRSVGGGGADISCKQAGIHRCTRIWREFLVLPSRHVNVDIAFFHFRAYEVYKNDRGGRGSVLTKYEPVASHMDPFRVRNDCFGKSGNMTICYRRPKIYIYIYILSIYI